MIATTLLAAEQRFPPSFFLKKLRADQSRLKLLNARLKPLFLLERSYVPTSLKQREKEKTKQSGRGSFSPSRARLGGVTGMLRPGQEGPSHAGTASGGGTGSFLHE